MTHLELFSVQGLPVLQNKVFPDRATALACAKGDMRLVQDGHSGLVYNAAFDADLLHYDADYQNEQAHSTVFQHHLEAVGSIIGRHLAGRSLIEVGCGKGYFLEYLHQAGYDITGIDPAYDGNNPGIVKAPFAVGLGLSAQGIVLRHVLEHILRPLDFLGAIARANGNRGLIYLEVPCLDWICRRRAWFDISYEHVNYFRLGDFHRIFGDVRESGHIFGGQYLYVVADLASLRQPRRDDAGRIDFPADFLHSITALAAAARARPCTIWGASTKGVVFAWHMQRALVNIRQAIDINPAKQGRFMAGSGIEIHSPADGTRNMQPGDDIFVMNSNYLDEIVAMTDGRYRYIQVDLDGL